ncbi:MAG: integrase arm-type DNA-binding domain-containing protein [Magnetococcales bacterium]|nr:integrase arm-type DNA-binding domain-containing protein [Magnetococcales bacterium]
MPLTDTAIKQSKPKDKPFRLADGGGLYLEIATSGGRLWRLKYRFGGKEKRLAFGSYPDVSLKQAREKRDEAHRLLAEGIDPGEHRKAAKAVVRASEKDSFQAVALEWFSKFQSTWTPGHADTIMSRLKRDVLPWMGDHLVGDITAPEVLKILRRVEERGAIETAHRIKAICGQVFAFAIATGRADRNPATDLRGALTPVTPKPMAAITDPLKIVGLLKAIDDYKGTFPVRCALQLAPITFLRPGELRMGEWQEIDFESMTWNIPGRRMKGKRDHVVPLSIQAIKILRDLQPLTGDGQYLFPSIRSNSRPMSENTVLVALRAMGFGKDEMSGHGFRSLASTRLNEMNYRPDLIEIQLAHKEKDKIRAAYNRSEYMEERRKMMQHWSDYLDQLAGRNVVELKTNTV